MKLNTLTRQEIKKHTIVWIIIIILINLLDPLTGNHRAAIIGGFITYSNYIFLYYALVLYVFPLLHQRQVRTFFVKLILLFTIYLSIKYIRTMFIVPILGGEPRLYGEPFIMFLLDALFQLTIIGSCAYVSYLNKLTIYKLTLQKQKEEDLINPELDFLKGQFNTHLTFNFLSFCYSHLSKHSIKASNSIEVFSDILEYSLRAKLQDTVPLDQEIEYIKNYITLQEALSAGVNVVFNCQSIAENKTILPRLLLTFAENAFLQGQINKQEHPIVIDLVISNEQLNYIVKYRIARNSRIFVNNRGEDDLKQILQMYYKGKYQISDELKNETYTSKLIINW